MQAQMKPIGGLTVEPAIAQDTTDLNPTQIRYGWNPYAPIYLTSPDGTISMYVQPHEIMVNGEVVQNPYHRVLPKGQLIPFPTFNGISFSLSDDKKDSKGAAVPVQTTRAITALEAITSVMRVYSEKGFIMLRSLQGIDQATADRIFRVVHPFEYRIGQLEFEMSAGAEARINSIGDLKFTLDDETEYVVPALRTDEERAIATNLAAEMAAGAAIAATMAEQIFNDTDISIKTRLSGGQGKVAPDPHDRYLAGELGRQFIDLSSVTGNGGLSPEIGQKLDFLVERETVRGKDAEIAELKRRLAEKDGSPIERKVVDQKTQATEVYGEPGGPAKAEVSSLGSANVGFCGRPTKAGGTCKSMTRDGNACAQHAEEEEEAGEQIAA